MISSGECANLRYGLSTLLIIDIVSEYWSFDARENKGLSKGAFTLIRVRFKFFEDRSCSTLSRISRKLFLRRYCFTILLMRLKISRLKSCFCFCLARFCFMFFSKFIFQSYPVVFKVYCGYIHPCAIKAVITVATPAVIAITQGSEAFFQGSDDIFGRNLA